MAFTLTAVKSTTQTTLTTLAATETITVGQAITTTGALADSSDPAKRNVRGVAAASGAIGDQIPIYSNVELENGTALTKGRHIILATAGQLQYDDQAQAGEKIIRVGIAISTTNILLQTQDTGVEL